MIELQVNQWAVTQTQMGQGIQEMCQSISMTRVYGQLRLIPMIASGSSDLDINLWPNSLIQLTPYSLRKTYK